VMGWGSDGGGGVEGILLNLCGRVGGGG